MFARSQEPQREAAVPGRFGQGSSGSWLKREEAIMGTAICVELWSEERAAGEAAIAAVIDEMHRIDREMSPHKPNSELSRINRDAGAGAVPVRAEMARLIVRAAEFSELSRINRDAGAGAVPVRAEMARLIVRAAEFSELSGGAFDITYAAVGHLYDYRQGIRPSEEALAEARAAVGWRHLVLDTQAGTVRFARPGMRIDLGGFAKGHAVDNAVAILRRRGIGHAMVSAGGDSRVIGDRRGRPWSIGVRDPRNPNRIVAMLPLEDVSISTSGDYERFFEADGVRFHHLIDPGTGKSPSGIQSVTILADDGLTSEALSKIVFVLGVTRGMALVESQQGVDAVVVDAAGALHFSSGLLAAPRSGQSPSQ